MFLTENMARRPLEVVNKQLLQTVIMVLLRLHLRVPLMLGSLLILVVLRIAESQLLGYVSWTGDFPISKSMIRQATSPIRDEVIVLEVGEDKTLTALMYKNAEVPDQPDQSHALPFSPLDTRAKDDYTFGFDIRYESQSGNALMVWRHDFRGDTIKYRTWNGSSWSSESTIIVPVSGEYDELKLEASPISNEIMLLVSVRIGQDFCLVWDGSSWGNGLAFGLQDRGSRRNLDVTYEQKSGRAMVAYTKNSPILYYHIWERAQWSRERSLSQPSGIRVDFTTEVMLAADPSSNRIALGVTMFSDHAVWLGVWDGNNQWGSVIRAASSAPTEGYHTLGIAFEGTSGQAMAAYVQTGNQIRYRTWNTDTSWSSQLTGPAISRPSAVTLSANPANDRLVLWARGGYSQPPYYSKAYECNWYGDAWALPETMLDPPYLFEWERLLPKEATTPSPTETPTVKPTQLPTTPPTNTPIYAPTALPTRNPTTQPTPAPTPSPTTRPTATPTPLPTPMPTSKPTQAPTSSPTTPPTVRPTPFPTPVPTMKPTPVPTTSPTSPPTETPTPFPTPLPTLIPTKPPRLPPPGSRDTGQDCTSDLDCLSNTCRSGVCMASSECYPLKHKYGTPFDKNKVNIVFVPSAFDKASREAWRDQVNTTFASFENFNMFSRDVEQLNVFYVDPEELEKSFCWFNCENVGRLLCCSIKKAHALSSKCLSVGENLQTVVIHNSPKYGGAGYTVSNLATVSSHPHAPLVAVHELGHSLFHLADEYWYGNAGTPSYPNCDASSTCKKWSDLIENPPTDSYSPVQCIPGCRNGTYYVAGKSFMEDLSKPMGAVNERFTCCTYQALTKTMPSYCNVFDASTDYLLNYCMGNDYQKYGAASYDKEQKLEILSSQGGKTKAKNVYVSHPMLVTITWRTRQNGKVRFTSKQTPVSPGMFRRSQVEGDFRKTKAAAKKGMYSLLKVVVLYRSTGKETLLFSQNTTVEVPLPDSEADPNQNEPRTVSQQPDAIEVILDTKGRRIRKIRAFAIATG